MPDMPKINSRVRHRAWKWDATVVDIPWDMSRLSNVTVVRDDRPNVEEEVWIPSIMSLDIEEELDWS